MGVYVKDERFHRFVRVDANLNLYRLLVKTRMI